MADEGFMFVQCIEALRACKERADRELAASTRASKELASAHRLLAIQYEADAD